jgi:hypothetical protein
MKMEPSPRMVVGCLMMTAKCKKGSLYLYQGGEVAYVIDYRYIYIGKHRDHDPLVSKDVHML